MIRLAILDDLPELQRMGRRFFEVSGYSELSEYNEDDMKEVFVKLIDNEFLYTDGKNGMIGFSMFPVFFCQDTIAAQELFWWVDEEKRGSILGIKLLKIAENKAKSLGANVFLMLSIDSLNGEEINNIYKKMGYKKQENTYIRRL